MPVQVVRAPVREVGSSSLPALRSKSSQPEGFLFFDLFLTFGYHQFSIFISLQIYLIINNFKAGTDQCNNKFIQLQLNLHSMKYFQQALKIALSEADISKAAHFADAVLATVRYGDTLQFNQEKIRDDHFVSKLGEEATRRAFEQCGCQVQGPDYSIYTGRQKSWDSDLYIDGMALAVKTQRSSAAQRYGLSWTFQQSKFRTDPILAKPEAWVCFVEYCDLEEGCICTVFEPLQMGVLPLKAPRLARLVGKKIAVYAADIPNFVSNPSKG